MEGNKDVEQKIVQLTELMKNPSRNEGSVLRIFHNIFQLTHQGDDLSPEKVEWLSEMARTFLSLELLKILIKLRLEIYAFLFAAVSFIDIDDVIDDLSNGDTLKSVTSFPPGAFNKLKRELLSSLQQNSLNQPLLMDSASTVMMKAEDINPKPDVLLEHQHLNGSAPSYDEAISLPSNITARHRLAEELLPHCRFVEENSNGMKLYQLPLTRKHSILPSMTERWVLGEKPSITNLETKAILLMGETGVGKTTLLNAMLNYVLGVEWDDPFRFLLISDEGTSKMINRQAHSQTSKVTAYELHYQEGFKIPYSLIIVDTPGYCDTNSSTTNGIDRDAQITDAIQQFFKDKKGIQELDSIGFTMKSASARLTATQKYIFESILAIFGKDVRENISFLMTHSDGQTPLALDAIKEAKIPHRLDANGQPSHNRFNNSGFFASNKKDGDDFGPMFWKLGMKNFDSFFAGLSSMKTISLTLTKEVLEERKHINVTIEGLTLKIQKQLTKMEDLRKTTALIETHKDQIKANKEFSYTTTKSEGEKVTLSNGECTTNCSKCSMSCHFPCGLAMTADKQNCAAMDREGLCVSCPLKCKWDLHLNQNYHWIFKDVMETKTYDDLKSKYETALKMKLSTEGVIKALQSDLNQTADDLNQDIEKITACLKRLDQIALRPDAFSTTDYIELMIQAETKEKKPGFKERIKSLNSLLQKANVMNKIRTGQAFY